MKTSSGGLRGFVRAVLAAAGLGAAALAAAQVTLYEHDNFQGRSYTAEGDVENFAPLGFNDRVSSAEVRGGAWQLCEDAGYRGQCITLNPGRHASLRAFGMNDRVSSARRAGSGGSAIELFEHDQFQGRRFATGENVANLAPLGFNDLASSVNVPGGQWQLCEDADYRGRCITLGPGRHGSLNALGFSDRVSSLRRLDDGAAPGAAAAAIELYEHDDFGGRAFRAAGPVVNLQSEGFNDAASSVQVRSGRWELCSDAEYRGRCIVLEPGSYRRLRERDMNDAVSSLRPLAAAPGTPPGQPAPGAPVIEKGMFETWRVKFDDGCVVYYNREGQRTVSEANCSAQQAQWADQVILQRPAR